MTFSADLSYTGTVPYHTPIHSLRLLVPFVVAGVADPHHVDADPDPACHFDADSDSTFHFAADPDPTFWIRVRILILA